MTKAGTIYKERKWGALLMLGIILLLFLGGIYLLNNNKPRNRGLSFAEIEGTTVDLLQAVVGKYKNELLGYMRDSDAKDVRLDLAFEGIGRGEEVLKDLDPFFVLESDSSLGNVLTDMWGRPYLLVIKNNNDFIDVEVVSTGEDGKIFVESGRMQEDDIKGLTDPTIPDYYWDKELGKGNKTKAHADQ